MPPKDPIVIEMRMHESAPFTGALNVYSLLSCVDVCDEQLLMIMMIRKCFTQAGQGVDNQSRVAGCCA